MPSITYNPNREIPARNSTLTINGVHLKPGVNLLSGEDFDKISSYDQIEVYKNWGALVFTEEVNLNSFIPQELDTKQTSIPRKTRLAKETIPVNE
jgi:hypothetical protein